LNESEGVEFIVDISEHKRVEALLRQSESRFRFIVESAKEYAIFTLDLNNVVTSWNAGAENLLGYSEAEIIGRSGRIIFTPEDQEQGRSEREIQIALTQGQALKVIRSSLSIYLPLSKVEPCTLVGPQRLQECDVLQASGLIPD
jgi:PAS domain-containing protein